MNNGLSASPAPGAKTKADLENEIGFCYQEVLTAPGL